MRKIIQTRLHGDPKGGNCTEACIASILGLSIDDVPEIGLFGDSWRDACVLFFKSRGYRLEFDCYPGTRPDTWITTVVEGPSPRGNFRHACIYSCERDPEQTPVLVHDPYPGGKGLEAIELVWNISYIIKDVR